MDLGSNNLVYSAHQLKTCAPVPPRPQRHLPVSLADYFIPLQNEKDTKAFLDKWKPNAIEMMRQVVHERKEAYRYLTHKDLALYSAYRVIRCLQGAVMGEALSFSLHTDRSSLMLRVDEICLSITLSHAGTAKPVEKPVLLPPDTRTKTCGCCPAGVFSAMS